MPRIIDPAEREAEIVAASLKLLARHGPRALTIRALARELGGSSTLVTHFYPTHNELLKAIMAHLVRQYDADLAALDAIEDPRTGLRAVLEWLLPITPGDRGIERRRILLSAEANTEEHVHGYLSEMDAKIRGAIRRHLVALVEPSKVDTYIDVLRAVTNGIILASVDSPATWPPERQVATLDVVIDSLGLSNAQPAGPRR